MTFKVRAPTDKEWVALGPELHELRELNRRMMEQRERLQRLVFALCGPDADIDERTGMLKVATEQEP